MTDPTLAALWRNAGPAGKAGIVLRALIGLAALALVLAFAIAIVGFASHLLVHLLAAGWGWL